LEAAQIDITHEWVENDFIFTHHPKHPGVEGAYIFAGHVHPVYSLRSGGSPTLRLPCFVFDEHQAILPSFGVFTGGYNVEVRTGRKIFVIGEKEIFKV
jgi:metallophosphoesterase superfamily enzyme